MEAGNPWDGYYNTTHAGLQMILSTLQQASSHVFIVGKVAIQCGIPACIVALANAMLMLHNYSTQKSLLEAWYAKKNTGSHLSSGIIRFSNVLGGFFDDSHSL